MPHQYLTRRSLPFLVAGLFGLSGLLGLLAVRPPLWSPVWWALLLLGAVGPWIVLLDWQREGARLPYSLALNLALMVIFWIEPYSLVGPTLLVLLTGLVAALFQGVALLAHLLLTVITLSVAIGRGVVWGRVAFAAIPVIGLVLLMRWLHGRMKEQADQADHLRRLLELLPVLKAHGVADVVMAAVRHVVKATASDLGILFVLDESRQVLRPRYLHSENTLSPDEEHALMQAEVAMGVGLSGWAAQYQEALVTGDAANDPRAMQVPGTAVVDESIMVVPLLTDGRLHGVLRIDRQGINKYRDADLRLLELMADHVSDAISRAQIEERMARRDALTGVYNRHFLNEWSERAAKSIGEVSILMMDCRGFKRINDRWGHLEGDRVLKECARLISATVRSGDLVIRYGGDEFLVVLDNTDHETAVAIAHRLQERVAAWNATQGEDQPHLALDIGVDTAPQPDWHMLLDRADERMYACKLV